MKFVKRTKICLNLGNYNIFLFFYERERGQKRALEMGEKEQEKREKRGKRKKEIFLGTLL